MSVTPVLTRACSASLDSPEEYFNVPDCITLDRYQQTFFALTNRNLPFVHASIPIIDRAPGAPSQGIALPPMSIN